MGISVDLRDIHLLAVCPKCMAELFVDGCKVLAVPTPWSKEFDKTWFAGLQDNIIKVLRSKVQDGGFGCEDAIEDGEGGEEKVAQASHCVCGVVGEKLCPNNYQVLV